MKKISLIVIFLILSITLCGCGNINITCLIDDNNNVEMTIDITIPKEGYSDDEIISIDYSIEELIEQWESKDYEVTFDDLDDQFVIKLQKGTQGQNIEDAVNELLDIMGNDNSPFSLIEGGYSESYLSKLYNIKAEVDLSKVLDYYYIDSIPAEQQDRINEIKDSFSGSIIFDFTGTVKDSIGNVTDNTNTVELSLDEPTEIYSLVEVVNPENQAEYQKLVDEAIELNETRSLYLTLVLSAAGLLIVLAAVVIFLILRRKSKTKTEDSSDTQVKEVEPAKKEVIDSDTKEPEVEDENSDKE